MRPPVLVQEAASIIQPLADENNVELRLHLEHVGEAYWDKRSIQRVLVNLGTDAVDACRFDPDRGKNFVVAMSLGLKGRAEGEERIVIEVSDNGCGMDEEIKEKIFSRFFSTKGGQGTGLGLLLSKKIVEEHGGPISFDSMLGVRGPNSE